VYAAFGVMMALYERMRSGVGQVIDVALYESAFSMMEEVVTSYDKTGFVPTRQGPRLMNTAPNSLYPTSDDHWVLIAANNDPIFRRLARVMGHPEWATDERYATQRARGQRVDEVDGLMTGWTSKQTAEEVQRQLIAAEVPVARVNTIADIYQDQHYRAREMLLKIAHPVLGSVTMAGIVPKLSRTPGAIVKPGPALGEDTRGVLKTELGMDDAQVDRLAAQGVVWCADVAAGQPRTGRPLDEADQSSAATR
jgi:crotonobetainyl-CoA:carnitine CoA-transferase CaiB-like acyl-CoA transferase